MSLELCFGLHEFVNGFLEIKTGVLIVIYFERKKIHRVKQLGGEGWGTFSVYRFQRLLNLWKIINMKEHEKGIRMTERKDLRVGGEVHEIWVNNKECFLRDRQRDRHSNLQP